MERSFSAQADFDSMAATFKCLSDPSRLQLLAILLDGETNVGKLASQCGLSPSATSHQLRVLRNLRFVSANREGQQVNYRINDEHIRDLMEQAYKHSLHLQSSELRDK
jgi:DNA-binding transcriptional ArsR family regulator